MCRSGRTLVKNVLSKKEYHKPDQVSVLAADQTMIRNSGIAPYGTQKKKEDFDPFELFDLVNSEDWRESAKRRQQLPRSRPAFDGYSQAEHIKKSLWESERGNGPHIPLNNGNRPGMDT